MSAAAIDLLLREISNPDTQWSLGTFGAIAEFSRDHGEPVRLVQSADAVSAVTPRGGIALKPHAAIRAFASEGISKTGWNQRVALCLPQDDCAMNRRAALTEIGLDHDAPREADRDSVLFDLGFAALQADFCVRIGDPVLAARLREHTGRAALTEIGLDHDAPREADRDSVLFDLGLGALQADFCIRIGDPVLAARLREHTGRAVFEPGNPAMGMILAANPHRVFISRIGRIEVYQPIPPPSGKSPEGPHTHVLPRLLKSGRTHPATEPVPEGLVPCAYLYPPHPARDGLGDARPFDATHHHAFQRMMAACGDPAALATKRRVVDAVLAGEPPTGVAGDRHGRISVRIALRQMKSQGHASAALSAWLASFDSAAPYEADDEAALHHEG